MGRLQEMTAIQRPPMKSKPVWLAQETSCRLVLLLQWRRAQMHQTHLETRWSTGALSPLAWEPFGHWQASSLHQSFDLEGDGPRGSSRLFPSTAASYIIQLLFSIHRS